MILKTDFKDGSIKVDLVKEKSINPYLVDKIKKEVKPLYHDGS